MLFGVLPTEALKSLESCFREPSVNLQFLSRRALSSGLWSQLGWEMLLT